MSSRHLQRKDSKASTKTGNYWIDRKDLFDEVVTTKTPDFIAEFINNVDDRFIGRFAKEPTLAALFIKRPDIVDQVLKKIDTMTMIWCI